MTEHEKECIAYAFRIMIGVGSVVGIIILVLYLLGFGR